MVWGGTVRGKHHLSAALRLRAAVGTATMAPAGAISEAWAMSVIDPEARTNRDVGGGVPGSAPAAAAGDAMTVPEAVETLLGAVERAGRPWSFVAAAVLPGVDLEQDGRRSWPVSLPDGRLLGMVVREDTGPSRHDELIRVLLRTMNALLTAAQATAAAERRASEAEREARIDPLTGVSNRRAWLDALVVEEARMRRNQQGAIVVMIDIDGLKDVNDREGHLAGDLMIRRAAQGLRRAMRETDLVARLGGDEFGVLAVDADPWAPPTLVERIEQALRDVEVSASIGAAAARPGDTLALVMDEADRAMYCEKRRRRRARRGATIDLRQPPTPALPADPPGDPAP